MDISRFRCLSCLSKYTSFEIAIAQPGVSELINIKINDIDNNRMVINIRHSKGNKDI